MTDKIHVELANYEQLERDIEKIIQPYLFEGEKEHLTLTQAVEILLIRYDQALGHCMKRLKEKNEKLKKIKEILEVYYDDDWKATREIERIINDR